MSCQQKLIEHLLEEEDPELGVVRCRFQIKLSKTSRLVQAEEFSAHLKRIIIQVFNVRKQSYYDHFSNSLTNQCLFVNGNVSETYVGRDNILPLSCQLYHA